MKDSIVIKQFGKEVARIEVIKGNENSKWFHNHCSSSMDWALRYEGYSYEIIKQ